MHQVRASHILLDSEEKAREVLRLLETGESFERLASAHSKCPSRDSGGDLGWFSRGMMAQPFEDVCFAMREGETFGPVRTAGGLHIVRITGERCSRLRLLVAADLHFESTGPEPIRRLVAGMDREAPDLVILAGDIGTPLHNFHEALRCFLPLDCPVAVLPGNHDVWASNGYTSSELFGEHLPRLIREFGFHWLENEPLLLANGTAVCGTIGWYDYSGRDEGSLETTDAIRRRKKELCADALCVNWEYTDPEFAGECRARLESQLTRLEQDERVARILAVTHMPCFEAQIERRPHDEEWTLGMAYFAHLTLGESLRRFLKVRWSVAGHTHIGTNGLVERADAPPIAVGTIGSDYGRPRWVTLEV